MDRAKSFFETEAEEFPPYRYELALLFFRRGQYAEAATSLRFGFVENGYIAKVLCGNPHPLPTGIWHRTSWAGPDLAVEYASDYGNLWHQEADAIAFIRWLHSHPAVMAERARVLKQQEALLWEQNPDRRQTSWHMERVARASINNRLSEEIVIKRIDSNGHSVRPWLHLHGPNGTGSVSRRH
ncbi:MAG: hypothetical protein OXL68_21240 [Paracoccaceae bacterium]|nr:hypothetical protein [Paracoccaceae bacterium]